MASYKMKEETNWNRASRLLTEAGKDLLTRFLHQFFKTTAFPSLDALLSSHRKTTLQMLIDKQILHETQMDILFPSSGFTDTDQWDITLLASVLHNCFRNKTPLQKNSLQKIKELRNRLAHDSSRRMDDDKFAQAWKDIKDVLTVAAKDLLDNPHSLDIMPKVQQILKEENINGEQLRDILLAWKACDVDLFDAIEKVQAGQGDMKTLIVDVRDSTKEMKNMMEEKKKDVSEIKNFMAEVKESHAEIKESFSNQGKEISEIKTILQRKGENHIPGSCQLESAEQGQRTHDTHTFLSQPSCHKATAMCSDGQSSSRKRKYGEDLPVAQTSREQAVCTGATSPDQTSASVSDQELCPPLPPELHDVQSGLLEYYTTFIVKSTIDVEKVSGHTHISEIYADPHLELIDHNAPTTDRATGKKINAKDLFSEQGTKYRKIYVTGDAGMGKTVFCKDIVAAWCHAQRGEDTGKIPILKSFAFLFYISLRYASDQYEIEEMIFSQLLDNNHFLKSPESGGKDPRDVLKHLLHDYSEKCLIILDGLDEWEAPTKSKYPIISNGVPGRSPHLRYTILTTARPWKMEVLRLTDLEIDRQIVLKGIDSVDDYGRKIMSYYNSLSNHHKQFEVFECIMAERNLQHMKRIPILYKQLVWLWHNDQPLGKSVTEVYTNMLELLFKLAENREGVSRFSIKNDNSKMDIPVTGTRFKKNGKCERYKPLLILLGEFAFDTLFQADGESKLVFESEETEISGLSREDIDICLAVGILTQSIMPSRVCHRKTISFLHKTFHEYFAALYLSVYGFTGSDREARIRKHFLSLDSIYDVEDMLVFLSGMRPSLVEALSGCFVDAMNNDQGVLNRRFSLDYLHFDTTMQSTMLRCCKESSDNDQHELLLPITDLTLYHLRPNDFNDLIRCLQKYPSELKSISLEFLLGTDFCNNDLGGIITYEVVQSGSSTLIKYHVDVLKFFNLRRFSSTLNYRQFNMSLLINESHLTVLNLNGVSSSHVFPVIKLATQLKVLSLKSVRDENTSICNLDLSGHSELVTLRLKRMSLGSVTLSTSLKQISMIEIDFLTQAGMCSLFTSISRVLSFESVHLESIWCKGSDAEGECKYTGDLLSSITDGHSLERIHFQSEKCEDHATGVESLFTVDFSAHGELKDIRLEKISVASVAVNSSARKITVKQVNLLTSDGLSCLLSSISSGHSLESIRFESVKCLKDRATGKECMYTLDFLGNCGLKDIHLENLSVASVAINSSARKITVKQVNLLNSDGLTCLFSSISDVHSLESIHLESVKCNDHAGVDCKYIVNLSGHAGLEKICLESISATSVTWSNSVSDVTIKKIHTLSHEGMHTLISSVEDAHSLKRVFLRSVKCGEQDIRDDCKYVINLSKHGELVRLNLEDMSPMSVSLPPFCQDIKLEDISVRTHEGMCSLISCISNTTSLFSIYINSVTCRDHANGEECEHNLDFSGHSNLLMLRLCDVSLMSVTLNPHIRFIYMNRVRLQKHKDLLSLKSFKSNAMPHQIVRFYSMVCKEHDGSTICVFT